MKQLFEVFGLVGTATVAIGYWPQVSHLAKERCSAGVSIVAWQIWLLSSVLIFSHAFETFDIVFIALQTVHVVAITVIISLAKRYRGMTCEFHRQAGHPVLGGTP